MDLINWSLNEIDTFLSMRSLGSRKPNHPAETFAAGHATAGKVECRVPGNVLNRGHLKDIQLFGTMIGSIRFCLIRIGSNLAYRRIKKLLKIPQGLAGTAMGKAMSTQTLLIEHNMDKILEKLTTLQQGIDRSGDQ